MEDWARNLRGLGPSREVKRRSKGVMGLRRQAHEESVECANSDCLCTARLVRGVARSRSFPRVGVDMDCGEAPWVVE